MAVAMDNAILENILRQVRPLIGQGKVADYIPALATVDGSRLGIAICTVDGQLFQAGDAQERFSIQSISKVLSLVVAMRHYSEEEIWQRVGKDPSGSPFNSLVQLEMEQGIPRNPFINAGALVVCDMLQGRLSAPRQRMLEVVRGWRPVVCTRTRGSLPGGWDYRRNLALVAVLWRLFRMKWPSQSGVRNWMMPVTRLRALPSLNN